MDGRHNNHIKLETTVLDAAQGMMKNKAGNHILGVGTALPTGAGWAVGALFNLTGTGAYINTGTTTVASFTAVESSASTIPSVDAGATTTLTVAQTGSVVLLNTSDVATLPSAATAEGVYYRFLTVTEATTAPQVQPDSTDVINLQGTDLTGGKYADPTAIGDTLGLWCDGTKWWTIDSQGTWTNEA